MFDALAPPVVTASARDLMPKFTIVHATDLAPDGGVAFAHGVALARDARATLISLHANPSAQVGAHDLPEAADLLATWAERGGAGGTVQHERRTHTCCDDPVDTLLDALRTVQPDLLVVSTHRMSGFRRLMKGSVSEAIALNATCPTLFLPIGGQGFIDDRGALTIHAALIPIGSTESAQRAIAGVTDLAHRCGITQLAIHLLHVGDGAVFEHLTLPDDARWQWHAHHATGDLSQVIRQTREAVNANLVVMATEGHNSVSDFFRGSHTEQLIRVSECPVMSIPMG
jgi:nucleotide-binding universal stress UspA family protein